MREEDIPSRIRRAEKDLIAIKSSQPITGDSWQTYRYSLSVNLVPNQKTYILFTLQNKFITTLAKVNDYIGGDLYPTCAGFQDGVFLWIAPEVFTNSTRTISISSSQPGYMTSATTPPF